MKESQVFYRKWRPAIFKEVVGQNHITKTLQKAIISNRIAHAYLLTGPRGVGKTSTARILAKALNSEISNEGEPLKNSEISLSIDSGNFLDLIEIDGASNRGIDDIRSLRDSTQFRPSMGNYKVYIIDEVHMLTIPAFNALLKTLEEPPEKVVFILCTTDAQKIPATIVSRCQRYDFKRLSNEDLIGRLIEICEEENIDCNPSVLELIANQSWGSLRDAENMLEQLSISYGNQKNEEISEDQARSLFGMSDKSTAIKFCLLLLQLNLKDSLNLINKESQKGSDLQALFNSSIDILRLCLLKKAGVKLDESDNLNLNNELDEILPNININNLLNILQTLSETKIQNNLSSPLEFELAVINALNKQPSNLNQNKIQNNKNIIDTSTNTQNISLEKKSKPNKEINKQNISQISEAISQNHTPVINNEIITNTSHQNKKPKDPSWEEILWIMRRTRNHKYTVGSLLRNAEIPKISNGKISLRFKSKSILDLFKEEMSHPKSKNSFKEAIEKVYSEPLEIELRSPREMGNDSPNTSKKETPIVRQALSLGAKILSEKNISEDKES